MVDTIVRDRVSAIKEKYNRFPASLENRETKLLNILEKRQSLHRKTELVKRKNQELCQKIEHLEQLSVVGKAWAMVAHEINNLLTPLTSYAQLALMDPEDPELVQKALEKAVCLGKQAAEILQRVPVLAGQQETEKVSYFVQQVVKDVFSAMARNFKKDGIKVHLDIPKELQVYMDPIGIRQVLMNLILNAREAMLPGGGCLTISAKADSQEVQLRIADTGCGMTPDQAEHIFEPFFTTKNGKEGQRKGNGVGLAFCKRVLENHGGTIQAESKAGEGTVFIIRLPHIP